MPFRLLKLIIIVVAGSVLAVELYIYSLASHPKGELVWQLQAPQQSTQNHPVVYLSGAINEPGNYMLATGTRLAEAINIAGGLSADVDANYVNSEMNLAAIVQDQQQIFIPFKQKLSAGVTDSAAEQTGFQSSSVVVNINTATVQELMVLKGVGQSTANKIVEARPYASVNDLINVSGIGQATLDQLSDQITI